MEHNGTYGEEWIASDSVERIAVCSDAAALTPHGFCGVVSAEERKANADLIIKAVNLHDELIAALRLIAEFGGKTLIDATGARSYSEGAHNAFEQAADIARSALAKAEAP